jgi:peptidoglycan/xylan/chitin deacetylase (PgdA/CDA1 family)
MLRKFAVALALLFPLATQAAASDRAAVQAACFPSQSLLAIPGERTPRHHIHTFDKQPQEINALDARSPIAAPLRGSIRRVLLPPGDKSIAFTFDLCEQRGEIAGYDGDIFDTLRRENVRATLFAGGKWLRSHAERAEQLASDPLFEIANHSETHRNLRLLSQSDVLNEITAPERDFRIVRDKLAARQCAASAPDATADLPSRLALFRFPFGACNSATLDAVNDAGYLAVQWSVATGDPDPHESAGAIAKAVLTHIKPGDIIVMHANGRGWNTAKALPALVSKLKARGFTFATVSELVARGQPLIAKSCYDNRPGDTDRYDFGVSLASKRSHRSKTTANSPNAWRATIRDNAEDRAKRKSVPSQHRDPR